MSTIKITGKIQNRGKRNVSVMMMTKCIGTGHRSWVGTSCNGSNNIHIVMGLRENKNNNKLYIIFYAKFVCHIPH